MIRHTCKHFFGLNFNRLGKSAFQETIMFKAKFQHCNVIQDSKLAHRLPDEIHPVNVLSAICIRPKLEEGCPAKINKLEHFAF